MRMRIITDPEIVVCVADAGSFRRAALQIGLSQSNVSRRVREIEKRVGQDLFARSGKAAQPTEAGKAYLQEARKAVSAMAAAETEARKFTPDQGLMSITAPSSFGRVIVAPAVSKYVAVKSDVRLKLLITDKLSDPAPFDLIIRAGPARRNDLIGRVLFRSRMKLIATPEMASQLKVLETPRDLQNAPTIGINDTRSRFRWYFEDSAGKNQRVDVLPKHVSNDVDSALALCRAGLGVTMLPDWCVTQDIQSGELVEILPSFPGADYPINVFSKSKTALSDRLSGIVRAIEEEIASTLK